MTKRKSEDFSDELKDQFKEGGCKPAATLLTEDEEKESFTEKRIRRVIEATLDEEIAYKKYELEKINEVSFFIKFKRLISLFVHLFYLF